LNAFAQWTNASSTSTPIPSVGTLPRTAQRASRSSSRTIAPRPFTRRVSSMPGIRKMRPTCAFCSRLRMPSRRLLPGRSGISRRRSSITSTKPGPSPLGETSHWPAALDVAISRNGERAMKLRQ
jgi:hypothetical protein